MNNFNYSIPTKIFFGRDQINVLGEQIKQYGSKVLFVYGGGSIKRTGLYDEVVTKLKDNGIEFAELPGVEPNPRIATVRKGIKLCREKGLNFILAVGGGSTIDCSKAIAAGYYYEGDPWDIVEDPSKITNVLPIASILTISATGSEMDPVAVISNTDTNEKLATSNPKMAPEFSICDPTYTFTVPKNQTAAGTADIMSHIFEVYFSNSKDTYVPNRLAEGLLKTCIKYGTIAMNHPDNYEARSNLMWASSLAINGILTYGKNVSWSVHPMEHELSAYYDITHGVGLAILTPHWMRYVLNKDTVYNFVEYGTNVWHIDEDQDAFDIANQAIDKTAEYFKSLGIPSTLREIGIGEEKLEEMAKQATRFGTIGTIKALDKDDVLNIFKASL